MDESERIARREPVAGPHETGEADVYNIARGDVESYTLSSGQSQSSIHKWDT